MKTVQISLNSIDKVKSFVNEITKYDNDFDLVSGRYVIAPNPLWEFSVLISPNRLILTFTQTATLMQSSLHLTRISSNNNSQTYLCVNAQCKKLSLLRQLFL